MIGALRRLAALPLSLSLALLGVACVEATNPFDPDTPPALQEPGQLTGRVVLRDETAAVEDLSLELAAVRVGLIDGDGRRLTQDGAPRLVTLVDFDVDAAAAAGSGRFVVEGLVPGAWTVVVEGVGRRYAPPAIVPVPVLPGDVADVGELVFVAAPAEGEGPGEISGSVTLADVAGGARSVTVYRLRDGVPQPAQTLRTAADGSFRVTGLALGTYAVEATLPGFTPGYLLDVQIGETADAQLVQDFTATPLVLHPITAVLRPQLPLVEGQRYTAADAVDVDVLAFGGVTDMALGVDDDPLATLTTYAATAAIPLPDREGPITLKARFEARSADGFVFSSDVFSATIVRDVTPPEVVDAAFIDAAVDDDGAAIANLVTGDTLTLRTQVQDAVSAVAGFAVVVGEAPTLAPPTAFDDLTSFGGLLSRDDEVGLGTDGTHYVGVFARDRAGNVGALGAALVARLDRTPPDLIVDADAPGGTLFSRAVAVGFDETQARADLPVAMQVGLAPLSPLAPVAPYASTTTVTLPATVTEGQIVQVEARLVDGNGNVAETRSAPLRVELRARLAGRVVVEGVPELEADASGATVRVQAHDGAALAATTTDAAGAFTLDVAECDACTLVVARAGSRAAQQALPPLAAQAPTSPRVALTDVALALARGSLAGRFRRADVESDATAHAGTTVTATLLGGARRFTTTTTTQDTGDWSLLGLPATRADERYLIRASRESYGVVTAEVAVAADANNIVCPDVGGAPTTLVLPATTGDFDLCASAGPCVPVTFVNVDSVRVALRDTARVTEIRVRARTPFLADDAEPAFAPFAPANDTLVDVRGADGVVPVYVQVRRDDGSVGAVLSATITLDTVPPSLVSVTRQKAEASLDERFTRERFVDVVVVADAGRGNVAPLASARAVVAAAAPAIAPAAAAAGVTTCIDGAACRVSLPDDDSGVVEGLHRVFAFACDAAGNCSAPGSTFVIHDRTAPSSAHGAGFSVTGGAVTSTADGFVLRSPLYFLSVSTGSARTAGGVAVVDESGAAVADVFGARFGFAPAVADVDTRALAAPVVAGATRTDVAAPPLPAVDGGYTVYARLSDAAGNVTAAEPNPFSAALRLDTTAPAAAFVLNDGASVTTSSTVRFAVAVPTGGEAIARVEVVADGGRFATGVVSRALPLNVQGEPFTLPDDGDGPYTVYARLFDVAGNVAERSASIPLDTTPPQVLFAACRTCTAVDGVLYTADALGVVLDVVADDVTSRVASLQTLVNGGATATTAYTGTVTVPVALDATSEIVVRAVDAAGLVGDDVAEEATLTVVHDRTAPTVPSGAVSLDAGAARTNDVDVTVTIADVSDANGVTGMRLSSTTAFAGPVLPFSSVATFALSGSDGDKQVCVELSDPVGNATVQCDTITLDRTAPVGTLTLASGAAVTKTNVVTAQLAFDAGTTGVAVSASALDCSTATYTAASGTTATATVTLSSGEGGKTAFACFTDAAGNRSAASDDIIVDQTAPASTIALAAGAAFTTTTSVTATITVLDAAKMSVLEGARTQAACDALAAAQYEPAASTKALTLSGAQGTKTVSACFEDAAGNRSVATDTIVLDSQAPTATVVVTGTTLGTVGANARAAIASTTLTRTPLVAVSLTGASTDASEIMISNDSGFVGEVFEPLVPGAYPHTLLSSDGTQTVNVKLRDAAGNTSGTLTASIVLDTQAPTAPTVLIDGGNAFTNNASALVSLSLSASASPVQLALSTTGDFSAPTFEAFATTKSGFALTTTAAPTGDGLKNVFVIFRDAAGNETAAASDAIQLDRVAPAPLADVPCGGSNAVVCINAGAAFSSSVSVTLSLTTSVVPPASSDANKATEMQIAVDGTADNEPFLPYASTTVALLAAGDCAAGNAACKTVAVRFRDAAGNTSSQFTDTIGLDGTPPTAPRIANPLSVTRDPTETVTLAVQATDTFGVTYQLLGGQFADWTTTAATNNFPFTLTTPPSSSAEAGDIYNLGVRALDPAGNVSGEDFVTITCDGNAPSAPTGLTAAERSGSVTLRWDRPPPAERDVVGYLVKYGYESNRLIDVFAAEGPSPIFVALPNGQASPNITLTGLVDNTPFSIAVTAVDHAGSSSSPPNESAATSTITVLPNPVTPVVVGGVARTAGSAAGVAVRGARAVAMKGTSVCVYDVANPTAPSEIACRSDAAFNGTERVHVFGRYAYVTRANASTRVLDIGRLGGSQRASTANVRVTALADAATTNIVDMAFLGVPTTSTGGLSAVAPPYVAAIRQNGANAELRVLQLPAATTNVLAGELGVVLGIAAVSLGGAAAAVDATTDLIAATSTTLTTIHPTADVSRFGRLTTVPGTIRDLKIEPAPDDTVPSTRPRRARGYIAGDFGLRVHDVSYVADGSLTPSVNNTPFAVVGGFDCSSLEIGGGYAYCNDTSASSSDTIIVIKLAPRPTVVGRLLALNTAVGAGAPAQVSAIALSENMLYATLLDSSTSLAAIELSSASRYLSEGSTNIDFDDVLLDRNLLSAYTVTTGGLMFGSVYDLSDPSSPAVVQTRIGSIASGCGAGANRRSRVATFGHTAMTSCADGFTFSTTNHPFNFVDPASGQQVQPTNRSSTDVSRTRGFVVDGHTAYVLTSDGQLETWSLARPSTTGPALTVTVAGAPSFSRNPVVQDDRLIAVDAAGTAHVFNLAATSTETPSVALIASVSSGAADTTRFGDLEVRDRAVFVTRALSQQGQVGLFKASFDPRTGALSNVTSSTQTRGFGVIAPVGRQLLLSDGFFAAGGEPGAVAGLVAVDATSMLVRSSTQAVLAPFALAVAGPTVVSVNRDSGIEVLTLSR